MVNKAVTALLDGLFPRYCALCGLRSHRGVALCDSCQHDLPMNNSCCYRCAIPLPQSGLADNARLCGSCLQRPPPFDRVVAPWLYCEYMAALIQRWKFGRDQRLTAVLAALWLCGAGRPNPVDLIIPVPLHWRRLWQRGFNQSELLCRRLRVTAPELATTPLRPFGLKRRRATPAQSGMNASERANNLKGAFTANLPCDNLRVAIVDDVLTTGATAGAAAAALRQAGASHIEIWCLARTDSPQR